MQEVSMLFLSIATVLVSINQISLTMKLKRLCKEVLILKQQQQRLEK